jgi:RHS repeat-associated protein
MKSTNKYIIFPSTEGYVKHTVNPSNGASEFDYVYQYKDHLGNIRISYTFDPATSSLKVLEENHYYPFGLKHTASLNKRDIVFEKELQLETATWIKSISLLGDVRKGVIVANSGYQYKYNGKEWQDELGLAVYDYGARNYDPALGRFFNLDRFSETYANINPYQYTANNPVKFIDVNGDYIYIYENGTGYRYDKGKVYSQDDKGKYNECSPVSGSYLEQIVSALTSITGGNDKSFGSHFLNLFSNDNINVNVKINNSSAANTRDRNVFQSGDRTVYTSSNQVVNTQTSEGLIASDFSTTLFHELGHAFSFNIFNSTIRSDTWFSVNTANGNKDVSNDEVFAVWVENKLREEKGLPIRTHYVTNQDGSIHKQSEIFVKSTVGRQLINSGNKLIMSSGYEMNKSSKTIFEKILTTPK